MTHISCYRYICDGDWIYDRDLPAFKDNQGRYSHVIKVKADKKVTVNKQLQEDNFEPDINIYRLSIRDTLNNMETCDRARDFVLSALTVKQSNSKLVRTPSPNRKNYKRNESSTNTEPLSSKLPIIKLRESVERDEIISELIVPYVPKSRDVRAAKSCDVPDITDKEDIINQLTDEVIYRVNAHKRDKYLKCITKHCFKKCLFFLDVTCTLYNL